MVASPVWQDGAVNYASRLRATEEFGKIVRTRRVGRARLNAPDSKSDIVARLSGVRIPHSPPATFQPPYNQCLNRLVSYVQQIGDADQNRFFRLKAGASLGLSLLSTMASTTPAGGAFSFLQEQLRRSTGGPVTSTVQTSALRECGFSTLRMSTVLGTNPCDSSPSTPARSSIQAGSPQLMACCVVPPLLKPYANELNHCSRE